MQSSLPLGIDYSSCIYCNAKFNNKYKATVHYVLGHRLKFCAVCCDLFDNDRDKITHENRQHWPFQCSKCYAEYINPAILEEHYRHSHSMQPCPFCNTVLIPSTESCNFLTEHFTSKHGTDQFDELAPAIIWTLTMSDDGLKYENKFRCHLCAQVKVLGSLVSHYQLGHKIELNKFLGFAVNSCDKDVVAIADALFEANAINNKKRKVPRRSLLEDTQEKLKKIQNSSVNKLVTINCNFSLVKRESSVDNVVVQSYDYDTSLVHCIASTEEEDELDDSTIESNDECKKLFPCHYCHMTLPTMRSLGMHMQKLHGFQLRNMENRCHPCRKVYATQSSLRKHCQKMHSTHGGDPIKCPFCDEEISNRIQMRAHIRLHIELQIPCTMDNVAFHCKFCSQRFWTIEQKNVHQLNRHSAEILENFILCSQCGVTFSSKTAMRFHVAEAHPSELPIGRLLFKCEICKIAYGELSAMRTHMLKVHPAKRRAYCQVKECQALVTDWELHVQMYHKPYVRAEYEYKCKRCEALVKGTEREADLHWRTCHAVEM